MSEENIFIVGANGQLGTALRQQYRHARFADISELDITDQQSVENFNWDDVKVIINAAAYTNVDGAETPEGRVAAWRVNATAVSILAAVANKIDATLVHISSDYVFDGVRKEHSEDEPFSPLSVYGASKAAGDIAAATAAKHYIFRTSWVVGEGKNFVRTMLDLADKNIPPTVVSDQIGRLTFTSELVKAINHFLDRTPNYGTYNISNDGEAVSWAAITRSIFNIVNRSDLTVTDITTHDYFASKENIAPRPLNSTLDLSKINAVGFKPQDWLVALKAYTNK